MPPIDLSVVVPTYREALNLEELVQRLSAVFTAEGIEGEIVVVDDGSDDGTEDLCARLARSHPVRLLVRRTERGLATAVMHGMRHAAGRVFLCMDADLSHPPESVPALYRAVDSGACEIAIGSRYAEGGSVDGEWGRFRRLNSKVATSLARGLTGVKDPMGGFFAIRREVFESVPPPAPLGYKILLDLLAKCPDARAMEIPIRFRDRKLGESKLDVRQQVLYLRHLRRLYKLRRPLLSEVLQYALVGLSGLAVDLLAFSLLHRLLLVHHLAARAASFVVAAAWNWAWNRRITFEGARAHARLPQWAGFPLVSATAFLLNWGTYWLLTTSSTFFLAAKELAIVCGVVAGFAFNYLGARLLVFGRGAVAERRGLRGQASPR